MGNVAKPLERSKLATSHLGCRSSISRGTKTLEKGLTGSRFSTTYGRMYLLWPQFTLSRAFSRRGRQALNSLEDTAPHILL